MAGVQSKTDEAVPLLDALLVPVTYYPQVFIQEIWFSIRIRAMLSPDWPGPSLHAIVHRRLDEEMKSPLRTASSSGGK